MNYKKTLDSGAELEITLSPFAIGHKLLKAVMSEVGLVRLSIGQVSNLAEMFRSELNDDIINTIKSLLAHIISSEAIEDALWKCMERATYNGKKITQATFEDMDARGDYFIVAKEVLWFNLFPFFKNLKSLVSQAQAARATNIPKSASVETKQF